MKETKSYTDLLEKRINLRTESLQHSVSLIRSTLEASADGILVVDKDEKIVDYNSHFITLWKIPQVILDLKDHQMILEYILPQLEEPEEFLAQIQNILQAKNQTFLDTIKFNDDRVFERYSHPHTLEGKTIGRVWSFRDITKRVALESKLEHQATHDALTGLPNRVLLMDRINHEIAFAKRYKSPFGILFIDLDRFKLINDSFSHSSGDELLKGVAIRIQDIIRETDTLARMGGDEFALVVPKLPSKEALHEVTDKILNVFQTPFNIAGRDLLITASVGMCIYPEDGNDGDELLSNADMAMYLAKKMGANQVQAYTNDLSQQACHRFEEEIALRNALKNKEFFLVYQPQININTNTLTAVESLIRWNHPTKGLLLPMDFIPMAEETGLIVPMGEWVIEEACRQNKAWQDSGYAPIRVVVNIESQLLKKEDLVLYIEKILKKTKLDPKYLEFELTENVIINNVDVFNRIIEIKNLGIKLALDDFGTGNSSINYLKRLPLDRIKIDKSFINEIDSKGSDEIIIKAIISMAGSLNLDILAEGVETQSQLDCLKTYHCDNIQGHYFSKALTPENLEEFMNKQAASKVKEFNDRAKKQKA